MLAKSAPTKTRSETGNLAQINIRAQYHMLAMNFQDGFPSLISGRSTRTWRSNRPGRNNAGSNISGRLVAAMMMTPLFVSNPSSPPKLVQRLLAFIMARP